MNAHEQGPSNGRAWAWPVGIAVGLGLVGVANAIMISIAMSNPSAPAAKDHWAESMAWDQQLELRERSAKLGWSLASLSWRDATQTQLELRLIDREGQPVTGAHGRMRLERNDTATGDLELELVELGEGRYVVDAASSAHALVRLTLDVAGTAEQRFVTEQQIDLGALPVAAPSRGVDPSGAGAS